MIYLDNAATTYPKPQAVIDAVAGCLKGYGANPSRGEYKLALKASRVVFETREKLARLFNINDSANIVFTLNATEAINLGLKGLLRPGDHIVTTSMEHNSVTRPLKALERKGVTTTKVACLRNGSLDPQLVEKAIEKNTKLIIATYASNVTGTIMPVEEIGEIARRKGLIFMLDSAQGAGIFPIDVEKLNVDLLAFSGHKGLLGPQGTGGLYISPKMELDELKQGGTGTDSKDASQPRSRPERYESGTLNTPGIAGLGKAIDFIEKVGIETILEKEERLRKQLVAELSKIKGIILYGPSEKERSAPIVLLNIEGLDSEEVVFVLDKECDIAARSGLHCSPDAHRTIGTLNQGAVRLSMGYFNTEEEIERTIEALAALARQAS